MAGSWFSFLWLLDFLNMGFPLYGGAVINTTCSKNSDEPTARSGWDLRIFNVFAGVSRSLLRHPLFGGDSQDIRHRFGANSSWRPLALLDCFPALALLGGIWSAHGNGNQFRHHHPCSHGGHALVQPLSRKSDGRHLIRVRICRLLRFAA